MWLSKYNPALKYKLIMRLRSILYSEFSGLIISRIYKNRLSNYGCTIDTNTNQISLSTKAKIWFGAYERAEVLFVRKFLRDEYDVIELGSSIGVVSSHIAAGLSSKNRLICVEANENLLSIIRKNVEINAPTANIEIIHAAVDYSNSDLVGFKIGKQNTISKKSHENCNTVKVQSVTLRKICDLYRIDQPFLLIMDIEGAEFDLIQKEFDTLKDCMLIIAELHETTGFCNGEHRLITVDEMADMIISVHGFRQMARWGNVFAFQRI